VSSSSILVSFAVGGGVLDRNIRATCAGPRLSAFSDQPSAC
jgi:hypothetical protein